MKKYLSYIGTTKITNTYQFIERLKVRTALILKFALETLRKVKIGITNNAKWQQKETVAR